MATDPQLGIKECIFARHVHCKDSPAFQTRGMLEAQKTGEANWDKLTLKGKKETAENESSAHG